MTTPDFHPYLIEGDLRTPEDVLGWLAEQAEAEPASITMRMYERLYDRLDRERRQACRVAMTEAWGHAKEARRNERYYAKYADWQARCGQVPDYALDRAKEHRIDRIVYAGRALAFREEARKP